MDNISIVMIAFKRLYDYIEKVRYNDIVVSESVYENNNKTSPINIK